MATSQERHNGSPSYMLKQELRARKSEKMQAVALKKKSIRKSNGETPAQRMATETKKLLIDKNRELLLRILREWHIYTLKQFKKRM